MAARGLGTKYQGSKWIRPERRLALYARDGFACVYCDAGVEEGIVLSLDHLTPHSQGGTNANENLVTACTRCNSSRADRAVGEFVEIVALYLDHGIRAADIMAHIIETTRQREPDLAAAKELIARRGSYRAALESH